MLRRIVTTAAAAAAAVAFATGPGFGWGNEGHEIVATVAATILSQDSPATLDKVKAILATEDGKPWTPQWNQTDIAAEATWADFCREKSEKCKKITEEWHFVNTDFDHPNFAAVCPNHAPPPGEASMGPPDCVIDKIEQFTKELANPHTSPAERLLALKFLLHFVGDIHQPLHAITRTDPQIGHEDRGGNCVGILRGHATEPLRLHSYWDTELVQFALKKNVNEAAAALMPLVTANKQKWSGGSAADWANESYALGHSTAYHGVIDTNPVQTDFVFKEEDGKPDNQCGPSKVYRISPDYDTKAEAVVKEQLAKAGVRLARRLQDNLH
jgi:hypothetical protein